MTLINWLLKPKCMLKCIYIFFKVFFVIKKIQYEFFSFERLGRMHKEKSFFFLKTGYF